MFDAFGGALCVFAVVAMMAALRTGGVISRARRRVLWEVGGMGAAVVVAHALVGSADAVFAMIVALLLAGGTAAAFARLRVECVPHGAWMQSLIAAAALGSTLFAHADAWKAPEAALAGGALALFVACCAALARIRVKLPDASIASSLHFACAGACAAIAYTAGLQQGALAVVIVSAMAALIGAHLTKAIADDAWPALVSTLNGYAACSVVAAGMGLGSGVLLVTGVALSIGCVASHARAMQSRASYSK
ncbi:NAD(P) transhydrogenase subunit beta [Caballeronia glathei]|jgi:NAD/NADP transhydrogenase beta subunit|uniref:Uncharacterized protein n=1 Tax=Caballeronia glathei TaxID=60547 RepID=A0A069PKV4_9BURK|nr:hypothetical protein [Caballeronia glathei]KDR41235.1 hypothetical protein BG61_20330 [Caballeronia glathei]CDY76035.1 NAD(P) transhydrogenase subunit beta [Caballeronia glathei]